MTRFTRKEFLEALFNEYFKKRDGFVLVRTIKHLDRKVSTRYFPNIEILAKEQYLEDQNIFFGVCPRETMKPERSHIRYLTALWAGLDFGSEGYSGKNLYFFSTSQAAKAVRSFPLPPSIIVESGRGMHLYWLLTDVAFVANPQLIESTLRKISDYFQCQTEVPIDSVLRLPGTFNSKMPGQRMTCEVKFINADFRYDLAEFQDLNFRELTSSIDRPKPQPTEASGRAADGQSSEAPQQITDEDDEDLSTEFEDLLASEPEIPKQWAVAEQLPNPVLNGTPRQAAQPSDRASSHEFEPVPYEASAPVKETTGRAAGDSAQQLLEDRIADRVAERVAEKLMNELVDKIVDKLAMKLMNPGG